MLLSNRSLSWANLALGLWFVATPFLFDIVDLVPILNLIIVGLLIGAFAIATALSKITGIGYVNLFLGLWVVASPFIFGYAGNTVVLVTNIFVGLLVVALTIIAEYYYVPAGLVAEKAAAEAEVRRVA